jgi:hypothetical protein
MTPEHVLPLDPRTRQAIGELQGLIARRYPTASFEVARAADDPAGIHLVAVVDVEDPNEVADLVVDRVVELQVEERIPIHVIPLRTPERVAASLRERQQVGRRARRSRPLLGRLPSSGR